MTITSETEDEGALADLRIGGTEVQYYVYCPRRLWWYSHGMQQEHAGSNSGQEHVALGQLLHQSSYPDKTRKEVLIDDLLRIDFTEDGIVHEVKKSSSGQKAAFYQLLYYLYYLKHEKGIETTGMIDYPLQRRREEVKLTPEYEEDVRRIVQGIQATRDMPCPPVIDKPMAICKKCSYQELCWG